MRPGGVCGRGPLLRVACFSDTRQSSGPARSIHRARLLYSSISPSISFRPSFVFDEEKKIESTPTESASAIARAEASPCCA